MQVVRTTTLSLFDLTKTEVAVLTEALVHHANTVGVTAEDTNTAWKLLDGIDPAQAERVVR